MFKKSISSFQKRKVSNMATTVISLDPKVTALNEFMNEWGPRIAAKKGVAVSDLMVQEADVVMGVAFNTKSNVYNFKIFGDNEFPFEQKLSDKDVFLCNEISAHLMKADVTAGDYAKVLYSYIDKTAFDGALGGVKETASLEAWYHGVLNVTRGGINIIENFRLRNLMQVPDRQLVDGVYPTMNQEAYKLTRKRIFGGKDKLSISVALGELSSAQRALIDGKTTSGGAAAANLQNFGILILKGFVISEAAEAYYSLK